MGKQDLLFVEDDPTWHELYKLILGGRYTLRFATGIQEALEAIEDKRPDAVAIDYWLSDGTAANLVPCLKGIPYVIVSSEKPDKTFNESLVIEGIDTRYFVDKGKFYVNFEPTLKKAMEESTRKAGR